MFLGASFLLPVRMSPCCQPFFSGSSNAVVLGHVVPCWFLSAPDSSSCQCGCHLLFVQRGEAATSHEQDIGISWKRASKNGRKLMFLFFSLFFVETVNPKHISCWKWWQREAWHDSDPTFLLPPFFLSFLPSSPLSLPPFLVSSLLLR